MTSQPPSCRFQVLFVFSRISLFSFKSTHLCYYATHTQQKLVFRWSLGKHALQTKQYGVLFANHKFVGPRSVGLSLLQRPGTAPN